MRILIPTILSTRHRVGVTTYLIGLLDALQEIDNTNEYFIITTNENRKFFSITNSNFHEITVPLFDISKAMLRLQYLIFSKIFLRHLLNKYNIDLIHEPCTWFINKNIKTVVTIHDVVELGNSKYFFVFNFIKQKMILSSIKNASEIISVSNQSKSKIKEIQNRDITTIYNGFSRLYKVDRNTQDRIIRKFQVRHKQYFIFLGTLLMHKNLLTLLRAFKEFNSKHPKYKLVLAGKKGNAFNHINSFIKNNNMQKSIITTDYLDEIEKSSLIKNSNGLLLVSKEEGFGFPILEAQSLQVPVITSDVSSMREVGGNSVIYINPNEYHSIANEMENVISDKLDINNIVELGLQNIKRFSWIDSAKATLKVYYKLFNQSNSSYKR